MTRKLSAKSDAAVALLIAGCVAPVAPSTGAAPIAPASRDYGPTVAQAVGAYLRTFKLDEKALAAGLAIPWAGVDPKRTDEAPEKSDPEMVTDPPPAVEPLPGERPVTWGDTWRASRSWRGRSAHWSGPGDGVGAIRS